jgi:hypothetical protein
VTYPGLSGSYHRLGAVSRLPVHLESEETAICVFSMHTAMR